ncbi:MAG TPA: START domain-containing protein [Bacteroidales bacterium]|nr:START domain-containing protein [Bacteroidales bacterium]
MSTKKLFLSMLLLLCFQYAFTQQWELKKESDGVRVYTRPVKGSGIREFKGEIIVKSNLCNILSVIQRISDYPKWMYNCSYAEQIKKVNEASGYIYSVLKQSWPVQDRDLCSYYSVVQDSITKVITITMKGVKDYIPVKSDKVRVPSLKGFWQLIPLAKGVTKIIYQVHSEAGGYVPETVVNAFITDSPYYNLLNLKKIVESPLCPHSKIENLKEF